MKVVIPFAMDVKLPEGTPQQLRGLPQLFTFIKSVALLHQHLLPVKKDNYGVEYMEATPEHLQIALELFAGIIITQGDRLNPSQRNFPERLKMHLKSTKNFRIPEVMKALGMSSSSFYREFNELKELGYVVAASGNKKKGIVYQISEWNDYQQLQDSVNDWSNELKTVKTISFPKDSRKFPKKQKGLERL